MEEIIFPNQIRMYRRLRGRSMQELADHLGVSLSAISKIEKGYRRIDQEQLVRVSELLDCPMQDLFVNEQNSQEEVVLSWRREQERRNRINERAGLKTLGAGLRQIRNEKNLTLIEVAESSDMTLSVYHRIEMGQREVSDKEFKNIMVNFKKEILDNKITYSKYNQKLIMDKCAVCGTTGTDKNKLITHHINFQKDCENGVVKDKPYINKNDEVITDTGEEKDAKININTASAEELKKLPGVGTSIALKIIEYRKTYGKFKQNKRQKVYF